MPGFYVHIAGLPPLLLDRGRPELTLGRAADLDLSINDPTISRHHARLSWRAGSVWLEDLGSRHGCFKNGLRIKAPALITPGDRVALSQLPLQLEAIPDPGDGRPGLDPEATPLTLSLADLRRWGQSGDSPGRLANWREALDLLHSTSLELLQDLEPEVLLDKLLDRLFLFLGASRGAVFLKGEAGALALLTVRAREDTSDGPPSISPATLEATIGRRAAIVFQEPAAGAQGRLAEFNTTSVMAVPFEHDGQILGLFYFDASGQRDPFTEMDLRFVATLSNLAAAKLLAQRVAVELRRKQDLERELQAREAAAQAKGEFLARMSHEIRTPMSIVLGFTELAQKETLPPRAVEHLKKIERSGRTLIRIVNDILDFSKMEAGALAIEAIPFRLDQVLEEVLDLFAPAAAEKQLALRLAPRAGLPRELLGDPFRLGQVLTNLVGNAIKFTAQGEVQVRVEQAGAADGRVRLRFAVQDTGIGIAPDQLSRIFSPYTQADGGISRQFGGTGLGLSISRKLVEMMGGTLTAASAGRGSTFAFTLAFAPVPAQEAGQALPAPFQAPDLQGRRLLLVEDNPLNQELARILLSEAGAQVDAVSSGSEALQRLEATDYAAVLMDIHMPGLDGCATTRRARAMGLTLPIIAMTAHPMEQHWDACLAAGMNDFVVKPIDSRLLFAALGRWVPGVAAAGGPGAGDQEAFGALAGIMDVPTALARVGGRTDLLVNFLKDFLDEPIQPSAIAEAMARGDRQRALRMAHDLKGIARTLALAGLADASAELEVRLEGTPPAGWEEPWERLRAAMAEFLACASRMPGGCH